MTDAYAKAGVDTGEADAAVARSSTSCGPSTSAGPRARCSRAATTRACSRSRRASGSPCRTDGVGSKLIVAEQAERYDTVGIDCVAMNVNDLICVGAEPIALLDYIAVERADPDVLARDRPRAQGRAPSRPGVEIPGGELAAAARPDPRPPVAARLRPRAATAFGTVALDAHRDRRGRRSPATRSSASPRAACTPTGSRSRAGRCSRTAASPSTTARPSSAAPRSPTRCSSRPSSTCARCSSCCAPTSRSTASPTSPATASTTCCACTRQVGYAISEPLPVPPVFDLIAALGGVADDEMWEVFNMGCGFVAVVPEDRAGDAAALLAAHHEGTRRIGTVIAERAIRR